VNAKTVRNSFKEIKIDKESQVKRIDPVDAVICSHKLAMLNKSKLDAGNYVTDEYLDKWWGLN